MGYTHFCYIYLHLGLRRLLFLDELAVHGESRVHMPVITVLFTKHSIECIFLGLAQGSSLDHEGMK